MLPSYLEKLTLDELKERANSLRELLNNCRLCPNNCEVNRFNNSVGKCNSSNEVFISSVGPHFGEEVPLVGTNGSGTIFFTNCNLSCQFCQNFDISQEGDGYRVTVNELARYMLALQKRGCHNINLVTPTHYTPQIIEALVLAIKAGLDIPLVYNCGGYEQVETILLLENIVDIYMPDLKYSSNNNAEKYSGIENYFNCAKKALKEMYKQVSDLVISPQGFAERGVLVRHLVLPNNIAGSRDIIKFIAEEISVETYVNIMDQYYPAFLTNNYPELNRRTTDIEFNDVIEYARDVGLHRGFE